MYLVFPLRSDHKDILEDVSESQQSGYSQCKSISIIINVIHLDLSYFTILY